MQTDTINCNNCGAPLTLPGGANYVHCNHCGTNLAVRRDANITYTEKLNSIDERTKDIQQQLGSISGQFKKPDPPETRPQMIGGGIMGLIIGCMFAAAGVFAATQAPRDGAPWIFTVFGLGFAAIGILLALASGATVIKGLVGEKSSASDMNNWSNDR